MDAHAVRRVFSVVTLTFVLTASAAEPWQERRFLIADRGTLVLSTPRAWTQQTSQSPPTIRFYNSTGQQFVVLITTLWSPTQDTSFNSSAKVRALVEETAVKLSPQAVERAIPINEMQSTAGKGYYFSVTVKDPGPNEYKYLTQGALAVDDLILTFRVLTNEAGSSVVNDAFDVLRSARRGT